MKPTTLAHCMDIFDWYNDPLYEYVHHILLAKLNGKARVQRALPSLIDSATELIATHHGTEAAFPTELLN